METLLAFFIIGGVVVYYTCPGLYQPIIYYISTPPTSKSRSCYARSAYFVGRGPGGGNNLPKNPTTGANIPANTEVVPHGA